MNIAPGPSRWIAMGIAVLALAACQTTSTNDGAAPEPDPEPELEPALVVAAPFEPADYHASVQHAEVRYRNLYAPESHAIWITQEVNRLKLDYDTSIGEPQVPELMEAAAAATTHFAVIECRLESNFADSSIAYDAIGLRSIEVYLETADGERIYPIQRIVDANVSQSVDQALLRFGRTITLIFPSGSGYGAAPTDLSGTPSVRLVVDGFHSIYYFEWHSVNAESMASPSSNLSDSRKALDAVRSGFASFYATLRPLRNIVD